MEECIALVPLHEHADRSATLAFDEDGVFMLGRNPETRLDTSCFSDCLTLLSRSHAKVTIKLGSLHIEPMGRNSIYVNCCEIKCSSTTLLQIGGDTYQLYFKLISTLDIVSLLRLKDRFAFSYEVRMVAVGHAQKKLKRSPDPKIYECPICLEILALAHICSCGSSYCYSCFRNIASTPGQGRCAMCKVPWQHPTTLTPNLRLDAIILSYAESLDDASAIVNLRRRLDCNAELKRNDVRMRLFGGGLVLTQEPPSSNTDHSSQSPRIALPRLVEKLEFHLATPPHPSSRPEIVDLSLETVTPSIGIREALQLDAGDADCIDISEDGSAEDVTGISPYQPLRNVSVGPATVSQGSCQHCGEGIEKGSTRLVFCQNARDERYLHLRCVGPFNVKRKELRGDCISYLSVRGRQDLSEGERTELKRAIRGKC